MPHEHVETHFMATNVVRDVVIGMADGLTVPFALAAGLSGAVDASTVIIVAGLVVWELRERRKAGATPTDRTE